MALNMDSRRKTRLVVTVLVTLSFLGSTPTWSEDEKSEEADPFFQLRGIDDRAGVFLGYIGSRADTTARFDSEFGFGTTLLLEQIFNLPRQQDYPRLKFYYRFSRKHRLDVGYLRVSSSGTNVLIDETIEVGPFTFDIGASIGARQNTQLGTLEYRYAFLNNGKAEAGFTVGVGVIDADLEIFGEAGISPGPRVSASERFAETIPLPVAGVYTDFTLTRRLFLSFEGSLFTANYDEYSGNVSDVQAAIRWYPTKLFGFGAAFNRTRLDVDVELEDGIVSLDYIFEGPSVFITFVVPGLR